MLGLRLRLVFLLKLEDARVGLIDYFASANRSLLPKLCVGHCQRKFAGLSSPPTTEN